MFLSVARRRELACAVIACSMSASAALAQQPTSQPDSLSRDLALALLGGGRYVIGSPKLYVGELSPSLKNLLYVPAAARLLGTAEFTTQSFTLLDVAGPPDSVKQLVPRELARSGWTPAPPFAGYGGGFRYAANPQSLPPSFCRDGVMLRVGYDQRQFPAVRVSYATTSGENNGCTPPRQFANTMQMPTLFHPAGSLYDAVCSRALSSGVSTNGTSAQLRSALPDDSLLDHYARQLQDSGWHAPPSGITTATRTMTRTDSSGAQFETTLTIRTVTATGCKQVDLSMRRFQRP